AVVRAVDTVTVAHVAADACFAGADVEHARVGVRDREGAHGGRLEVAVGNVPPVGAGVGGLPHAAGAGTKVEGALLGWVAGDGHAAATAMRADTSPFQCFEQPRIHRPMLYPGPAEWLGSPETA